MKLLRRLWITPIGIAAFVAIILVISFSPLRHLLSSPEQVRDRLADLGWLAPIVVILIHVLQVLVAFVPGQAIDFAIGYLFGWWGIFISLIGISLGSLAAIGLANRFGHPLMERILTRRGLRKLQPITRKRNQWFFFFLFLIPGTPDDLMCYAIGLSSIPWKRAAVIAILGRTPGVVAAVAAGSSGRSFDPWEFIVMAVAVSLIVLLVIWKVSAFQKVRLPAAKI